LPNPDSEPTLSGARPATKRPAGARTTDPPPWQSRVPLLLAVPAAIALLFLVLPLVGLVIRAPWAEAGDVLTGAGALQALKLSLITATVSVIIVLLIGVPLAWLLARPNLRGAALLRALITIPFLVLSVEGATARFRSSLRRGSRNARSAAGDGISARHLASDRARHCGRCRACLGPRSGRIRCDDHIRGQLSGHDAHHATRGLSGIGNRSWLGIAAFGAAAGRISRCTGSAPGTLGEQVVAELSADLGIRRGDFTLDLGAGEVVALLGPNSAGKSAALRALAGLLRLTSGHVTIDGSLVADAGSGIHRAPHERPIGVVFQDYLLFPHLTVLDNVAFGPLVRGLEKREARQRAAVWLSRVGIADLANAKPRSVSGGQAQRVALARALATEPQLLCWMSRSLRSTPKPICWCAPRCVAI
jgi:predicted ABC-type transport system involved in lysophospholipase L1 biosynthesis ATPase subunit